MLLIDAGTFGVMCLVALAMPRQAEQGPPDGSGGRLARIFLGFRVLWQLRPVMLLTIIGLADLLLAGMMEVFLPAFNKLTLHDGPAQYGLLVSVAGVSCLVGTLFFTPLVLRLGYSRALMVVLTLRGLTILPLAFVGFSAIPDGSGTTIGRTIQQRLVPGHLRGRFQGARSTRDYGVPARIRHRRTADRGDRNGHYGLVHDGRLSAPGGRRRPVTRTQDAD